MIAIGEWPDVPQITIEVFLAWDWGQWTTALTKMPREIYEQCTTLDSDGNSTTDEAAIMTWVSEHTEILDSEGLVHAHVHWINEEEEE